jgi:Ca-activated chloride channel family protein
MRPFSVVACSLLLFVGLTACGGGSDGSGDGAETQTVENNDVRLELPSAVPAGSPFEVKWEGPGNSNDYISIAEKGTDGNSYLNRTYTDNGSPLSIRTPDRPGDHEVRYVAGENDEVLARAPLTVEEVSATLKAPSSIGAGSPIEITWKGPKNPGDYISIAEKGTDGNSYLNRTYTDNGSPLTVQAPDTPGSYELRYVMGQSDRVLSSTDVKATPVSASFEVSDTLMVDTPVEIGWKGPKNPGDYISIAEKGTDDNDYVNRTYTDNGSPLSIRTPKRPGQYELRYVMGQSDRVINRKSLVVLPVQARLRAPDSVAAGTGLEVSWIGPNGPNDFIAVAAPEASANDYKSRALSRAGTPASVFAPGNPGTYELRYVWAEEDSVLTSTPLTVTQK